MYGGGRGWSGASGFLFQPTPPIRSSDDQKTCSPTHYSSDHLTIGSSRHLLPWSPCHLIGMSKPVDKLGVYIPRGMCIIRVGKEIRRNGGREIHHQNIRWQRNTVHGKIKTVKESPLKGTTKSAFIIEGNWVIRRAGRFRRSVGSLDDTHSFLNRIQSQKIVWQRNTEMVRFS